MVSFRVRASSLSEVASLLGTVIATFDANLSAVDSHVSRTVDVSWQGEDAESFGEGWATFVTTAAAVRQSLVALQTGLVAADGSYTQSESGIQRSFTGRIASVRGVGQAGRTVGARVDTGEERAELIEDFFGRDDDSGSAAFVGGGGARASSGQRAGSAPADDDDEVVEVDIDPALVPEGAPVADFASTEAQVDGASSAVGSVDARVDAGGPAAAQLSGGLDDLATAVGKVD